MKKLLSFVTVILLIVLASGCSEPSINEKKQEGLSGDGKRVEDISGSEVLLNEYGCEYYFVEQGVGQSHVVTLAPVIKDGKFVCKKDSANN